MKNNRHSKYKNKLSKNQLSKKGQKKRNSKRKYKSKTKKHQKGAGTKKNKGWTLVRTAINFTSLLNKLIKEHLHPIEGLYVLQMNDNKVDMSDLIRVGTTKGVSYDEMKDKLSSDGNIKNKIGNGVAEILEENAKRFDNNSNQNNAKFNKLRFLFPNGFQIKDNNYTCVIYKYQDPVVRMTCEYTMFVLKGINIDQNLNFDALCENVFEEYVNKTEGSLCEFGIGMTTCCSINMVEFIESAQDYIKDGINSLINSDIYQRMIQDEKYKNLENVSLSYEQLFKAPEELINDQRMKFKIKLIQCLINKIIIKSGRAEGILPPNMEHKLYPPISICEVLDKRNTIWMQRSESFHISRSPCVHAGIYGETAAQKALKIFGLDETYENLIWVHSIGHTLDRLFCGHRHLGKVKRTNKYIWLDMMTSIEIFARLNNVSFDTMYKRFFDVFDINYGYSNDAVTDECKELKQIYKCTKIMGTDKNNMDDYIENDPFVKEYLNTTDREQKFKLYDKLPLYTQKYIDWLWKSENFKQHRLFYKVQKSIN